MRFIGMALKGEHKAMMTLLEMEPAIPEPAISSKWQAALTDPVTISKVYANMIRQVRG